MPELERQAHSWRGDAGVPHFDDSRPLLVFDGVCVLCSSSTAFVMRRDKAGRINMASAQSPLGEALYRHYCMAPDDSYLFLRDGRAFTKTAATFALLNTLGGGWRLLNVARVMPEGLRDWLYDRIAANRYRWFGKADYCALLTPEQRARLLSKP